MNERGGFESGDEMTIPAVPSGPAPGASSCRGCVCGSGSPCRTVPPSTAAPTYSRWEDVRRRLPIVGCACGEDHASMPLINVDGELVDGVCRVHKRHVPCRRCDTDPKLDTRSFVAGFKMGVKIGLQDAAYSTYADNIESAGRLVEDLRDLDKRGPERWHE